MAELPKHYNLKKEEKDHYVIHDSRDKKEFKIAKKGLHPAHQLDIHRLQKFSEGSGDVEDTGEDGVDEGVMASGEANQEGFTPAPAEQASVEQTPPPGQMLEAPLATPVPQAAVGQGTVLAPQGAGQGSPAAAQAPQAAPPPAPAYPTSADLNKSVQQGIGAEYALSKAEQKQNDAVVAQQQKNLAAEQKYMEDSQAKLSAYQNSYDELWKKTMAQEIDPQRYWNSKDSHAKMRAGIGIMLSGLSGASNNMAMDVINKNIDRDIEAQKANLGKKQTLLSHNLAAQGSLIQAVNMTRVQMQAMSEGQLKLTAAKMGNPLISARANLAVSQMRQNAYPHLVNAANNDVQLQMKKEVMQKLAAHGPDGQHDVDLFDLQRAGFIDGSTAEKESAAISKRQQAEAYVTEQVGKLDKEQRVWGDGIIPNLANPGSYSRRDQYRAGIIQAIQSASPSKRLNPEMLATEVEPFLTKTLESDKTRQEGLKGLLSLIRSHADPTPHASKYRVKGAISGANTIPKDYNLGPVK